MSETNERISQIVESNDVVLFMKGTPLFPQCGFSSRAVAILDHCGVAYESVDVLQDMEIRQGIKAFSDWPTIPQLYVKGEFVGGSDIMMEMYQAGELQQLLDEPTRRQGRLRQAHIARRKGALRLPFCLQTRPMCVALRAGKQLGRSFQWTTA
jgi:monothiol glutaredoxin